MRLRFLLRNIYGHTAVVKCTSLKTKIQSEINETEI